MNEIICPKCGKLKKFKNENSYQANKNKTTVCKKCRWEGHSKKLIGRKRSLFTKEWRKNISPGHKKSEVWKRSMNTPEYKEKHRQKILKMINENKLSVCYNPNACVFFNKLNERFQWNGVHATNGNEKVLEGFYLDYYEPNQNLVIEWDEKHHKKSKIKQKDSFRQKIIMQKIECEFYRIDDETKIIRKVDKNITDRTVQLQSILNEYYEIKT